MLDELERILAQLYTTSERARHIVDRAGIPAANINLDGAMGEVWHGIVTEAANRRQLTALLRIVTEDYPQRTELKRINDTLLYLMRSVDYEEPMSDRELGVDHGRYSQANTLASLEHSVNRLNQIIRGTDWGAEGLQASTKRIEADCKSIGITTAQLKEDIDVLKRNQSFNRKMLTFLAILVLILLITQAVSVLGLLQGVGA